MMLCCGSTGAAALTVNEVAVNAACVALKIPMAPVVAPTGIVTRTCASLTTVTAALCAAPTHADVEPVKPLPFSVTTVPTGPEPGAKFMMLCCTSVGGGGVGGGGVGGGGVGGGGVGGGAAIGAPQSLANRAILSARTSKPSSRMPPVSPLFGV